MKLLNEVQKSKSFIKDKVDSRLNTCSSFAQKPNEEWFSELCFCILTANSKARTAIAIQNELGAKGFLTKSQNEISDTIKRNKHRFHNNKSKFIVEARKNKKRADLRQLKNKT